MEAGISSPRPWSIHRIPSAALISMDLTWRLSDTAAHSAGLGETHTKKATGHQHFPLWGPGPLHLVA